MQEKNELEIYLSAGLSMARKGQIVAASGMVQFEDGSIKVADIGYRPSAAAIAANVALYSPQPNNHAIDKMVIKLIRMAQVGALIGIGGVIVLRDGTADRVAIGSLRGLSAIMQAVTFQRPSYRVDRRQQPDRRRQGRLLSDPRRQAARD